MDKDKLLERLNELGSLKTQEFTNLKAIYDKELEHYNDLATLNSVAISKGIVMGIQMVRDLIVKGE